MLRTAALAVLAALLLGCQGHSTGDVSIPGISSPTPHASTSAAPVSSGSRSAGASLLESPVPSSSAVAAGRSGSACAPADPALLAAVSAGLSSGVTIRNAYVAQSTDSGGIYFLAGDLQGQTGLDQANDIAIFASSAADGTAKILAVGAVAKQYSTFDDGGKGTPKLTVSDPAATQARSCALAA